MLLPCHEGGAQGFLAARIRNELGHEWKRKIFYVAAALGAVPLSCPFWSCSVLCILTLELPKFSHSAHFH